MTQAKHEPFQIHPDKTENQCSSRNSPRGTVAQSIVIGSVAGAAEVLVNHPLWSIKTRIQCGDTFTLNPSMLYRGILANTVSMVPITALQVGLNRGIQNFFFNNTTELYNYQRITCAFVAGVGASGVSCSTEMIMTYQGQTGASFYAAANQLIKQNGWRCLLTGLPATAIREGLFTSFFLAGTPILKTKIQPYFTNDYVATLAAGIGAGVGATLASQGVDTLKTNQQTARVIRPVGLKEAAKKLYVTNGIQGFFKGGVPRGGRVVSAVTLMGLVNEKMEALFWQRDCKDDLSSPTAQQKPPEL